MSTQRFDYAVIFDVDGVLIDSFNAHFESWNHVAVEDGIPWTMERFAAGFGRTSREVILEAWASSSPSPEQVKSIDERKEALFRRIMRRDRPVMPGAIELIKRLSAAGYRLGIGSSGPPANIVLAIELLGCRHALQAVVTGADVRRGKPDPEVFLTAATRLGMSPSRCVVIEDAPVGVQAAHRAGMAAVALLSTGRTRSDFEREPPELMIDSLEELIPTDVRRLIASRAPASD